MLLIHRKESQLSRLLGGIQIPLDATGPRRISLVVKSQQPSQRPRLAIFAPELEEPIRDAGIEIHVERNEYDDALGAMTVILAHYLSSRYSAFVSQLGSTGTMCARTLPLRAPHPPCHATSRQSLCRFLGAFPGSSRLGSSREM